MANYEQKDFSHLLGTPGLSDALLQAHFDVYVGHLNNVNALSDELAGAPLNGTPSLDWSELKRRFGWEWNGMRLHELYFENLTRNPAPPEKGSVFGTRLVADFGSFLSWVKDFRATGSLRGIGWAALVWDGVAGRLHDIWIDEHDRGHLAGCSVILVMDVFEHAFAADYGAKRGRYIDAFLSAVDWSVAERRFEAAQASVLVLAGP